LGQAGVAAVRLVYTSTVSGLYLYQSRRRDPFQCCHAAWDLLV